MVEANILPYVNLTLLPLSELNNAPKEKCVGLTGQEDVNRFTFLRLV